MTKVNVLWNNGHEATYNSRRELEDAIGPNSLEKAQIKYAVECMEDNVLGVLSVDFGNILVSKT